MSLFNYMELQPFYKRLRSVRVSRGLTDLELAYKLNIDIDTYRLYESGSEPMPNFTIIRVSHILKCPALAMNVKGSGGRGSRGNR